MERIYEGGRCVDSCSCLTSIFVCCRRVCFSSPLSVGWVHTLYGNLSCLFVMERRV